MHFKGSKETLPQIGRDLKVDAVVEGTVTRGENRVRVTAQLVEASSDHHLWARTYERDLKDVLALQDEIAHDITEQIRVKLNPKARSLVLQAHTVDPEAYDAYLRGLYWAHSVWKGGAVQAPGKPSSTTRKRSPKIQTTRLPMPASRTPTSSWRTG